jgi:ABC-2 type transport system permease protein
MMIGVPAIQLMLFGFAIRTEVRNLPTVVLDESRSTESRALVQVMQNTHNFRLIGEAMSRVDLERFIKNGDARAAVIIPPEFATDIKRGRTAMAQVIVDAADPLASTAAISGAALAGAARSAEITIQRTGRGPPLEVRVRPWYNPALVSSAYIVPGIVGVLLSMTMILITSMAIVRERERGTLEQLVVTPIDKPSLMLGKIVPFVLVGYTQMSVVLLLGKVLFDIPVRGSVPLLYLITLGFIVTNLSLGLVLSTVARNQVQSMQLSFLIILPNILLSGFMFPREAMPEFAQWLGLALPLTYYLEILRGILLKGVGIEFLWEQTATLAVFAFVLMVVSVRLFAKRIE